MSTHNTPHSPSTQLLILAPVYNDWPAAAELARRLAGLQLASEVHLLFIDDGSTDPPEPLTKSLRESPPESLATLTILPLKRNLGHQRSIALGLAWAAENREFDHCVVMDCDGEDQPEDIPKLLEAAKSSERAELIFARRSRRAENLIFRCFYIIYRALFWLFTGTFMRFGNFSLIPRDLVERLVVSSELWMHYAGSIYKLRLPLRFVNLSRGKRYHGKSRMNLISLILHGLQAIAIYREIACVRIILTSLVLALGLIFSIGVVVFLRTFTDLAIPGWASSVVGLFLVMLFQVVSLALFFIFLVLGSRSMTEMLPARDHHYFIQPPQALWPVTTAASPTSS